MDPFDCWINELREKVIEEEFGYEPGEFTVYPGVWRHMFDEGLAPRQAWQRALDAHSNARVEDECLHAWNWARIQWEDTQAILAYKREMAKTELDELHRQ